MSVFVWRLDHYGLKEKDLKNLNKKIEVLIFFGSPVLKKMLSLSVPERKKFAEKHYQEILQKTIKDFSLEEVMVRDENRNAPDMVKAVISGPNLFKLFSSKANINAVQVEKVRGLKQIKMPKISDENWYLVTGLFAYQTKGKTTGTQPQDEQMNLVYAKSYADAERKAKQEFKKMEEVYLGTRYETMRTKFVKITDLKIVFSDNGQFDKKEFNFMSSRNLAPVKITPATAWK